MVVCTTYGGCVFLGNYNSGIGIPFYDNEKNDFTQFVYGATATFCSDFCDGAISIVTNCSGASDGRTTYRISST